MAAVLKDNLFASDGNGAGGRGWTVAMGVIMILTGLGAIIFPLISSIGVTISVAILLVIAGIAQIIQAFRYPKWSKLLLGFLIGILWLATGIALAARPLEGIYILTIFVAAAFIAEGILKAVFAARIRPASGWGWLLFDAAAAVAVGLLLWWQFPFSSLWALGLLAGINIMIAGWTLVMLPNLSGNPKEGVATEKASAAT